MYVRNKMYERNCRECRQLRDVLSPRANLRGNVEPDERSFVDKSAMYLLHVQLYIGISGFVYINHTRFAPFG